MSSSDEHWTFHFMRSFGAIQAACISAPYKIPVADEKTLERDLFIQPIALVSANGLCTT